MNEPTDTDKLKESLAFCDQMIRDLREVMAEAEKPALKGFSFNASKVQERTEHLKGALTELGRFIYEHQEFLRFR